MNIREIWRFADQVYCDNDFTSDQISKKVPCLSFEESNDFMKIWIDNGNLIIAFRGSDDIKDWIGNFCFGSLNQHEDFREAYEKFACELISFVSPNLDKNIIITGHSRGAAIATFCAEHLSNFASVSCITFASPRVGDKSFREYYNKLSIDHTNVFIECDIVPTLYTQYALGFRHVGKTLKLKKPFYWKLPPMRVYYRVKSHLRSTLTKSINKRWKLNSQEGKS